MGNRIKILHFRQKSHIVTTFYFHRIYWQREKADSNAEVDYMVQQGKNIVPVEVKANTKCSMQSIYQFLKGKGYPFGIRTLMENFGFYENIKVFPLYAVSQIVD